MFILLADVPPAVVSIDEFRFPDRDRTQIFEHLVRYCSKFDSLPAITILIENTKATVVRGHKYLLAAHALGRATIRAVITGSPTKQDFESFLSRTQSKGLDWETIKTAEARVPAPKGWHVFFFAHSLSSEQKIIFDEIVTILFPDQNIYVTYDEASPLAEFKAKTPVTDVVWMAKHLDAFATFSRVEVPIVSYQGRRFGLTAAPSQS